MLSRRSCTVGEVVADRTRSPSRTVHLEYHFDRLLPDKLAQTYELRIGQVLVDCSKPAAGKLPGGGE
jgi:hypothetical protein